MFFRLRCVIINLKKFCNEGGLEGMKINGLWIFLSCCVLSSGIAYAGQEIACQLPESADIPQSLYVTTNEQGKSQEFGDYLSIYEAAEYLNLSQENVEELIESGEWDPVAYPVNDQYIISKTAVQDWLETKLRGE